MCELVVLLSMLTGATLDANPVSEPAITLYIAPNGNDAWSGTMADPADDDGPLASLDGARMRIRELREGNALEGGVEVLVRDGVYRVEEAVTFTPEDSGTAESPIVYRAYPGANPVISGGRAITDWEVDGERWRTHLPEVEAGEWYFASAWVDGEHQNPARWPSEGFHRTVARASDSLGVTDPEEVDALNRQAIGFAEGDIQEWTNPEDIFVGMMQSWEVYYGRIEEIDFENRVLHFKIPSWWVFGHWTGPDQRYYVENVYEALDAPGEWYLNRQTGVLEYIPQEGDDPETTAFIAPVADAVVRIEGDLEAGHFVEHLHFDGLTFAHTRHEIPEDGMLDFQAAYNVHAAFMADGWRHGSMRNGTVRETSHHGVWLRWGCQDVTLFQNRIHHLGAGGVRIGHGESPRDDHHVTERITVENNWIHDGGYMFPAGCGLWIGRSSHNRLAHNEISDFYYTGISVGWSWGYAPSTANHNIIEYNYVHHLGKELLSDMGGIYLLGDSPGTEVRNNIFHDIYSFSYGGWGLYPDEGSTDILFENNIVYKTKTGGFHQHYGKENIVRNNIFAFAREDQLQRTREEEHISFFFERNIVYYNNGRLLGSNWNNDRFVMDYNCYWDAGTGDVHFQGQSLDEWQARGHDQHSIIADPLFVDPENYDFRLQPDSPVFELGFEPIDPEPVGLYGDDEWVNAPRQIPREPIPLPEPPEPVSLTDDFEETSVGSRPSDAQLIEEHPEATVRVTDETAHTGNHSLKFVSHPGQEFRHNPHIYYQLRHQSGRAVLSFAVRMEPGAEFWHEWRDGGAEGYRVGPTLNIDADGALTASDQSVATVPHDEWVTITIETTLGIGTTSGVYQVTVDIPGQDTIQVEQLPYGTPDFRMLGWLGFIAYSEGDGVFYLDDLDLRIE